MWHKVQKIAKCVRPVPLPFVAQPLPRVILKNDDAIAAKVNYPVTLLQQNAIQKQPHNSIIYVGKSCNQYRRKNMTTVLSVGGSIIAPNKVDTTFVKDFVAMISEYLLEDNGRQVVLVAGGGGVAREYQNAYKAIAGDAVESATLDKIGIAATRLNAQLLKSAFGGLCTAGVICNCDSLLCTDETCAVASDSRVVVAAGWKPGFSTDMDAVLLADKFHATTVVNLSNIEKVYTADPRTNKDAAPIDKICWADFCKMVGSEWTPGGNYPFDPVASRFASEHKMKVICAGGRNLQNTRNILLGLDFVGTTIG